MTFVVEFRSLDSQVPLQTLPKLLKDSYAQFAKGGLDPRIESMYLYAGELAGVMVINADSGDALEEVLRTIPVAVAGALTVHVVVSAASAVLTADSYPET